MACKYCPTDQVESGLRGQRFFLLECNICRAIFYSPGNRKKVPGWKDGELVPQYEKYVEFESGEERKKWSKARRKAR